MYALQHGALVHTEQKAIKGPKITSVKPFKRENQRSNLYKKRESLSKYKKQNIKEIKTNKLIAL